MWLHIRTSLNMSTTVAHYGANYYSQEEEDYRNIIDINILCESIDWLTDWLTDWVYNMKVWAVREN